MLSYNNNNIRSYNQYTDIRRSREHLSELLVNAFDNGDHYYRRK